MRRLFALAALSIATAIVLAPATAGANTVTPAVNCEAFHFTWQDFPESQDVPIDVAVTVPDGEGALFHETIQTNHHVSGTASGVFEVGVRHTVTLTVSWDLDGTHHVQTAHSDVVCAPPETTTTTVPPSTTTSSTTSTTVPASTTTSTTTSIISVPPGEKPTPHSLPGTGAESKNLAAGAGMAVFAGWVLVRRTRQRRVA